MENPEFLKEKYGLHNAPEVENAAKRTESRTGEKVPQDPSARIENYLDRLERLALDPEKEQKKRMFGNEPRPRALSLLREMVMNRYVRPNKEKMAEGAARVEERAARDMGIEAHYGEEELEHRGDIAVTDLEKSLDSWISYLSDANEFYPTWFRYYAFRNILDLGDYDKDKGEFTKRSQGTARLFPDIDRGALAYVEQMIEASKDAPMLARLQEAQRSAAQGSIPEDQLITQEKAKQFAKFSFAKQYAEGIKQSGEITPEMREETRGAWVKYQQGTEPTALWASLQNKGTAWCTKGFATAEIQLKGGDFYVYYTLDKQGKPAIPRIAIRMEGHDTISNDVRGVLDSQQNIEGAMIPILDEKLKDFGPEADRFKKRSSDMRQVTDLYGKCFAIDKKTGAKTSLNPELTKDDLAFLYELNTPIEGFGYEKDPRIKELREQRDPKEDMPVIFECEKSQIAHTLKEINKNTKAYVGKLVPHIFEKIQEYNIENIYTSFPEGRIRMETIEIGGKDADTLIKEMKKKKINIDDDAEHMMRSKDFTIQKKTESETLVRLKVGDLGFPEGEYPTTDETYERIEELGLDLCLPETGPHYRLHYTNQPMGEYFRIGMKQIAGRDGRPSVFDLFRHVGGLWLDGAWTLPTYEWFPGYEFVFRLRKLKKLGNLETLPV